jgi:hypothetical protein
MNKQLIIFSVRLMHELRFVNISSKSASLIQAAAAARWAI